MSQQVTAIIHLAKRGRSASNRYGKFLRPDKCPHPQATDLHLWEGRELSVEEFNTLFPIALSSVIGTDTVFGQIIVREVEGEALDAEGLDKLKKEHEASVPVAETSQPNPEAEKPAEETISEESSQVEAPLVEAEPSVAGEQPAASVTDEPVTAEADATKAKATPKAKAAAKK